MRRGHVAGVLAPAQFVWLKLVDRGLWYAVHSLGFETEHGERYLHPDPRVEAIGARDHWAVEWLLGASVVEPAIERALDALRQASDQRASGVRAQRSASGIWKSILSNLSVPVVTVVVRAGHAPSDVRRNSSAASLVLCKTRISCTLAMLV